MYGLSVTGCLLKGLIKCETFEKLNMFDLVDRNILLEFTAKEGLEFTR